MGVPAQAGIPQNKNDIMGNAAMMPRMAVLGAAVLLSPMICEASTVYAGGAGLYATRPDYSDVNASTGGKAMLGMRFSPVPLFIEASYLDTGKADVDDSGGLSLRFSGFTLGAGLFGQVTPQGSGGFLGVAYYDGKTKLAGPGGSVDQNATGFSLSLGLVYKFNDWIGIRGDVETLFDVKDFAYDKKIDTYSVGLIFEFGGERPRAPSASYAAEPAPSAPVLESTPVSVEPAAPPPSPPRPKPAPAFGGVPLSMDVPLKTQPRAASRTQLVLRAGTAVRASQPVRNADGDWYYAEDAAGHSGWIPASAVLR